LKLSSKMSLTVQQLLSDAKRLSSRLRDHDQSADQLISRAQEVLKEVDAMRQYQEDVENLNEVAHNRPRAQLVLGIQQENRHIRTLQQENKDLRAALEEHQNALELIMSKYRQHVTRLVNTPQADINTINNNKIQMLAERTEKVCEMAAVMKEAVRVDEESCNQQQELMAKLVTENKGLRELLEISQKSSSCPKVKKIVSNVHKEVQTDQISEAVEQVVSVTLPMPSQPKPPPRSPKTGKNRNCVAIETVESSNNLECNMSELSSGDSDETGSEDESVKFDTIKKKETNSTAKKADNISPIDNASEYQKELEPNSPTQSCIIGESDSRLSLDSEAYNTSPSTASVDEVYPSPLQNPQEQAKTETELTKSQQNVIEVSNLVEKIVSDSVAGGSQIENSIDFSTKDENTVKHIDQMSESSSQCTTVSTDNASLVSGSKVQICQSSEGSNMDPSTSHQSVNSSGKVAENSLSRSNTKNKKKNSDRSNKNSPKKGSKK